MAILLVFPAFGLACAMTTPPPAAPPPVDPPAPPPPPPPKCESLEENCVAGADTRVLLEGTSASFVPPEGWAYAKESSLSLALAPNGEAAIAFTAAPSAERDPVMEALGRLFERLEISRVRIPALKARLRKAQHTIDAEGFQIQLWEVDKRRQWGREPTFQDKGAGTMLVAVAPLLEDEVVVATGFVVAPDTESTAAAVMQAVQSLRAAP